MHFLSEDCELLKKYKKIWDKVSNVLKKEFDGDLFFFFFFNECKIKKDFHDKKKRKVGSKSVSNIN